MTLTVSRYAEHTLMNKLLRCCSASAVVCLHLVSAPHARPASPVLHADKLCV